MIKRDDLADQAKPYATFYQGPGGQVAQIHTRRIEGLPFGRVGWRLTASASDESGATTSDVSGLHILAGADGEIFAHEVTFQFDSVADIASEIEAARVSLAEKACNAAEVWRSAADI